MLLVWLVQAVFGSSLPIYMGWKNNRVRMKRGATLEVEAEPNHPAESKAGTTEVSV